jgi:exodeoxyribonuclease V alpha subunit
MNTINALHQAGVLTDLDRHFAAFMMQLSGSNDPALALGAALASRWVSEGHICLDLNQVANRPLPLEESLDMPMPPLSDWLTRLHGSTVVSAPGGRAPLILDNRARLYLYRYWEYEQNLAAWLRRAAAAPPLAVAWEKLEADLAHLFKDPAPDWQKIAAITALSKRFCVIAGGPGTGKTTTVVKILRLLLRAEPDLRIELAAPTGKAAARLQESIAQAQAGLDFQAATLHRLLGSVPGSPYFRHDRHHPLALDVLVLDEASMVDLALMSKLVDALPAHARLILLGDPDQLASVEAGAVLGDICAAAGDGATPLAAASAPMQDCVVTLRHSRRFRGDSSIGRAAALINSGDSDGLLALLSETRTDMGWRANADLRAERARIVQGFLPLLQAATPQAALTAFGAFRVLCAHRNGPFGVRTVNRLIEDMLADSGLLRPTQQWYPNRPILITENDYSLNLFNGDTGILRYSDDGRLRAWFASPDGGLRALLPARLPPHESVFAMTVHKSQGSEFDEVLIYLPDSPSPLLTRELLYTAVTRARQRIFIAAPAASLRQAVTSRSWRGSGLRDALQENVP